MATPRVGKALVYNPEGEILTLFRSETHPHLAHYVDFPGGLIEQDEEPEVAIAREFEEETGYIVEATQVSIERSGVSQNSNGKGETQYYLGKIALAETPEMTLSWEHERYEWLAAAALLKQMAQQTEATDTFWNYVRDYLTGDQDIE